MNPDDLTRDQLVTILDQLQDRLDDAEARFETMARERAHDRQRISTLEDEVDQLRDGLDDVREDATLAQAQTPEQQQNKLANIKAILQYATTDASGGRAGVVIETGEATAAINGSRSTARRLMDEIGGTFSWAETKNPGGPNPKQLRLAIAGRDLSGLLTDVRHHYADSEGATA